MMGMYNYDEIREAFRLLDRNHSNTIDIDELFAFLPVLHPNMAKETLLLCFNRVCEHDNQQITFDEFRQLVLKGIARALVCGHV